ncbi:MAG TPA: MerR family transcriptional regulator [Patescibacteria group bacterium]|nr:MerR family transcriptional regulator [Patescibacteria group bacterium]
MQESNSINKEYLTIKEASKYLRVSKDTLRRWEKRKILKPFRSPTGWRYYSKRQLDYVFIQKPDISDTKSNVSIQPKQSIPNKSFNKEVIKDSILPLQISGKEDSKIRRVTTIFLAFFVSLNLMLLIFYVIKNLSSN